MRTIYFLLLFAVITIGFTSCEVEPIDESINLELSQIDKDDAGAIGDRGED